MIETAVVLDERRTPLHWHEPVGASVAALPDSRDLWDVLWANRERISGVAHSHPGGGPPRPSWEDLTTFAACEAGLGRRLEWWIATSDAVTCYTFRGPGRTDYAGRDPASPDETSAWLAELGHRSWRRP
jgi:hypothetical protein